MSVAQFHLAFPVRDLEEARAFYVNLIGCSVGRTTENHIDLNMYGHHVVAHLAPPETGKPFISEFDGTDVPVPHFGLNLEWQEWERLAERLTSGNANFRDRPHVRLKGRVGEHATLFVYDPSSNALEFKAFRDPTQTFAVDPNEDPNIRERDLVRARVAHVIRTERGRVEEDLKKAGIVTAENALDLRAPIEKEFGVALPKATVEDFASVAGIVALVMAARE